MDLTQGQCDTEQWWQLPNEELGAVSTEEFLGEILDAAAPLEGEREELLVARGSGVHGPSMGDLVGFLLFMARVRVISPSGVRWETMGAMVQQHGLQ